MKFKDIKTHEDYLAYLRTVPNEQYGVSFGEKMGEPLLLTDQGSVIIRANRIQAAEAKRSRKRAKRLKERK